VALNRNGCLTIRSKVEKSRRQAVGELDLDDRQRLLVQRKKDVLRKECCILSRRRKQFGFHGACAGSEAKAQYIFEFGVRHSPVEPRKLSSQRNPAPLQGEVAHSQLRVTSETRDPPRDISQATGHSQKYFWLLLPYPDAGFLRGVTVHKTARRSSTHHGAGVRLCLRYSYCTP